MNVVFVNEMRKSVFRRKPVLAVLYMAGAIVVLTLGVAQLIPFSGYNTSQYSIWRLPDFILPVLAPAFAASAFAKEHEQRTWQDVLLTRLSSSEILSGKFFAAFIPTLAAMSVLAMPLWLLLILQGAQWAYDPGPWMLVLAGKFLLSAICYIAVALVCSYHSPNARTGLAVSYGCLMAYAVVNYVAWTVIIPMVVRLFLWSSPSGYSDPYGTYYTPYSATTYGYHSRDFALSTLDWIYLAQNVVIAAGLLTYLFLQVRWRRR